MALIGEMQYLKIGGNTYSIPSSQDKSTATNWVNGSQTSSVRTVGSATENSSYTIGSYATAEGSGTKAIGEASHAEGGGTTANGNQSHAEGAGTTAEANFSHAEGVSTTASGLYSHAEGYQTTARGEAAHAEGAATKAYSKYSHAEGMNTEAYGRSQHVFGENNIVDSAQSSTNRATYVEIVGNGTNSSNLHNARTLDWSGNEWLAGKLTLGTTGTNTMDVATIGQLPTKTSDLINDSEFITGYTETDPVFSASAAAGITATDISNWNAKVSDDKTWNGISLNKTVYANSTTYILPFVTSTSATEAKLVNASAIPTAKTIAVYDANAYLKSTTPSANDNSTKVATTAYVDSAIDALPEPMVFKGSVGTSGTVTSLPTAAATNEGWTYKVITSLSSPTAKVGDTVISNGSNWVVIPSGDEPSGTVTSVGVSNATNGGLTISGSPITSSGTITIGHSNVLSSAQTTQAVYPIKIDKNGHISSYGTAINLEEMKFFLVTLTLTDENSGVYESDKTAKQIYDAFNAGQVVLMYVDGSYVLLSSVYGDDNYYQADFYQSRASTGSFYSYERIIVTDNNVTSVDSNYYETPVNDATLTIQKNGTTIKSFRANASSDVIANITVPTKNSELTNDSGFITSYTETDPVFSASAAAGITDTDINSWKNANSLQWNNTSKALRVSKNNSMTTIFSRSDLDIPTKTSDLTNDSGFITSETDPVFSASAAHGISSADITAWNSKSDFSGSYNDLTNKPTIPTKTMWVGECSTGVSTSLKVVTTTTGDFVLAAGNSVRIVFAYANQAGASLNIDGTGAKSLVNSSYKWQAGEIVDVIYNGTTYEFVDGGVASGTYYGVTKLSDSVTSTSQVLAATPYAVKQAYDLANSKSDFSGDYNDLTNKPTIPSATSDLTNDSGFITSSALPTNLSDLTNDCGFAKIHTSTAEPTSTDGVDGDIWIQYE